MDNSLNIKQQYNDALQSLNHLQNDYSTLKAQYDQAMTYVQQVEELHRLNNSLTKENNQLKKKIDDLQSRLEISLQTIRELQSQINSNKQVSSMDSIYKSIEKEKAALADQIEQINLTLKESQRKIKEKSKENETLAKGIDALIETAQNKFNVQFESLSDFISFLSDPNQETHKNSPENDSYENSVYYSRNDSKYDELQSLNMEKDEHIRKLKTKLKKLKQKLQQVLKMSSKSQSRCIELEKMVKNQETTENSISALTTKYENQIGQITKLFEGQIKSKEDQIASLNQQLKESKSIVQPPPLIQIPQGTNMQSIEKINSLTDELCETKAKLQSQMHKNKELYLTISSMKKSNQILIANANRFESSNDSLKKMLEKSEFHEKELEKDLGESREEAQNLRIEIEELKTQIHFNESKAKAEAASSSKKNSYIEELTMSISNYKVELNSLQNILSKQKKEIATLYTERKSIVVLLQRQSQLLKLFDEQVTQVDSQKKAISKQLAEIDMSKAKLISQHQMQQQQMQRQIEQQQELIKTETDVPLNSWMSPGFPQELSKMISDEAKNDRIPVSTKIHNVVSLIDKFYSELIEGIIQKSKEEKKINKQEKGLFKKFVKDVLRAFEMDANNLNENLPNEVCQNVIQMKQTISSLQEENDRLSGIINQFTEKTNSANFTEADEKVEKLYKALHKAKENLKNCTSKNKKMRKVIEEQNSRIEKESKEFNEMIQNLQIENDKLKFELNSNQNHLKIVNIENEKVKNDLQAEKMNYEEAVKTANNLHNQQLSEISDKHQKEQNELKERIEKLQEKLSFLANKLNSMNKENEHLKKAILLQKNIRESLNRQISELKNGFLVNNQEMTSKFKEEKESIHSSYNKIVSQLKNKNEILRNLLDKVTENLSETETKNRDLAAENTKIAAEKREAAVALESNVAAMKREKQLMETKVRALQLANDVKSQNFQEEIDQKVAKTKQKIFALVAKAFSKFFDASLSLDDDQFEGILNSASDEMKRLEKQEESLRHLLAVPPGKLIEDAVAKLMVSTYRQ